MICHASNPLYKWHDSFLLILEKKSLHRSHILKNSHPIIIYKNSTPSFSKIAFSFLSFFMCVCVSPFKYWIPITTMISIIIIFINHYGEKNQSYEWKHCHIVFLVPLHEAPKLDLDFDSESLNHVHDSIISTSLWFQPFLYWEHFKSKGSFKSLDKEEIKRKGNINKYKFVV